MRRPGDWLRQAELDLDAARGAQAGRHFEWACFLAQQAAEKGVKAAHESVGTEAWGHSVAALLEGLEPAAPEDVVDAAKGLDKHYIPARYPKRSSPRRARRPLHRARRRPGARRRGHGARPCQKPSSIDLTTAP